MKHEPTINEHKTVFLKYLNQKISFHIYDDMFYYYIEAFIKLPNYSKNVKDWIRKQFDWFFLKLLREGKLVKKAYSDKITQNIKKSIKNRSNRHYFLKGYTSVLTLLNKSEREKHQFGIRKLRFKKSEIPFFHNVRLMVNGKLLILKRDINDLMVKEGYNNLYEVFETFMNMGLQINGIGIRDITTLELVSLEVSELIIEFDKTENRYIPILRYGKSRKRDLGFYGFENYYDYIDNSDGLEYEIQYFNRKQKIIPELIRELDFLLPFDIKVPIIECFDITATREPKSNLKNDFLLEHEMFTEINGLYGFGYSSKYRKDSIFNFT